MNHSTQPEIARAQRYRFLARLFLSEPDAVMLSTVAHDDAFAATLPSDIRDLHVEFTRLFALNVYPYASFFLDAEAALHTETTVRVQMAYERAGFELEATLPVAAPDHFGAELLFIAHLLGIERTEEANRFLCDEVLPWAEIFLHAVEKHARAEFYRTMAIQTRAWFIRDLESHCPQATFHFALPSAFDEENDLAVIVTQLVSPARSGIFLSKGDLSRIAHAAELPISFGDRALMLKSLFRAAGEYSRVTELLDALRAETCVWVSAYISFALQHPIIEPIVSTWIKRTQATLDQIVRMKRDTQRAE